ncbi:hypothetical protein ACOME3_005526 [Neoechinorhynchus agilis]
MSRNGKHSTAKTILGAMDELNDELSSLAVQLLRLEHSLDGVLGRLSECPNPGSMDILKEAWRIGMFQSIAGVVTTDSESLIKRLYPSSEIMEASTSLNGTLESPECSEYSKESESELDKQDSHSSSSTDLEDCLFYGSTKYTISHTKKMR